MILNADTADDSLNTQRTRVRVVREPSASSAFTPTRDVSTKRPRYGRPTEFIP